MNKRWKWTTEWTSLQLLLTNLVDQYSYRIQNYYQKTCHSKYKSTFIYSIIPIHLIAISLRKNERKRKVGKSSCKGLIMRIINNFVAEQVVNAYIYLF